MNSALALISPRGRSVLRTLSPRTQYFITEELRQDPSQIGLVEALLKEKDPEASIASEISRQIVSAIDGGMSGYGLGFRMPKVKNIVNTAKQVVQQVEAAPKKVADQVSNVAQKVVDDPKKLVQKVASWSSIPAAVATHTKFGQQMIQNVRDVAKKYGPTALVVSAAVASPFTGGASMAIIPLVQGYQAVQVKKREARAAAEANNQQAEVLNSQAAAMEQQSSADIDAFYNEYQQVFTSAGYPPNRWASMTLDEKYAALQQLQTAAAQVESDAQAGAAAGASSGGYPSDAPQAPSGTYDLVVEGKKVASAGTLEELAPKIESMTSPGDRFEVLFNGQSTGLKIRSNAGIISVPAAQEAQVRAMTPAQVKDVVAKSETAAGVPKSGFPLWLLAIPAAAVLATK